MGSLRISEAFCVNERSTMPGLTSVMKEQWPVVCTCTTSVSTTSLPQTAPKKRSERRDEATHAPAISTSSDTTPLLPASSARLA